MQVHLLRAVFKMVDGATHATAVAFFDDQKAAEKECHNKNAGINSIMGWSIVGPNGTQGPSVWQFLSLFGLLGVGFDVVSVETQGAILKPEPKIVVAH